MFRILVLAMRCLLLHLCGHGDLLRQLAIQKSVIQALQDKGRVQCATYDLELKQGKDGRFGMRLYYYVPDDVPNRLFMEEYSQLVLKETNHYLRVLNKRIRIFLQNSAKS